MNDKKKFIEDGLIYICKDVYPHAPESLRQPSIELFDDGKSVKLIQDFGDEQKIVICEGGTEDQRYNTLMSILIENTFYGLPKFKK